MSTASILSGAIDAVLSIFGETVMYSPAGDDPVEITAAIEPEVYQHFDSAQETDFDTRVIHVKKTDVPSPNVAGREVADTFILPNDIRTWYLRRVMSDDGIAWKLLLADTITAFID